MQCANCNEILREQDRFCPMCGTPVEKDTPSPCDGELETPQSPQDTREHDEDEHTQTEHTEDELLEEEEDSTEESAAADGQKPSRRVHKPIWALLALLLIGFSTLVILLLANINLKSDKHVRLLSKGLTPVRITTEESSAWGFMDESGALAIPPMYEEATAFCDNGLAAVCLEGKWGYINTEGETMIPFRYDYAREFQNGDFAPVKLNGRWGYIDHEGNTVINLQFDDARPFAENGLALVSIGEQCGYINRRGVYVIPPQFTAAASFDEDGYATVCAYGKWGMIDHSGDYIINPQFDTNFAFSDNGFAVVKQGDCYGYIDRAGSFIASPQFLEAYPFAGNGLALAKSDNGKYGYINIKGEWEIYAKYDKALPFADNGLAAVCLSADVGLWGYIDKTGSFKLSPVYQDASTFSCGLASVRDDTGYYFINDKGEEVIRLTGFKIPSRFTADGFCVLRCYSFYEDETGALIPLATHYEVINTSGTILTTDSITAFSPSHLLYILGDLEDFALWQIYLDILPEIG